jgi:hypothetical protein
MILNYSVVDSLLLFSMAAAVLVLIGLVWVLWTPTLGRDPLERFADSIGLSISIITLVALLFYVFHWVFSGWLVTLVLLICFVVVILAALAGKLKVKKDKFVPAFLVVLGVLGLIYWRFYQAESLVFPPWVDSVHHVLVTQKIIDHAGIPRTLGPELPVPFHYHFGFHLIAALFTWLTQLSASDAVLWFGQVINALVAVGIYRLGKSIWHTKRAAGIAALLVGLAFQMPAYYLTWGRYTLLTGLLVLLPATAAAYDLVLKGSTNERVLRLLILTAGLSLTHYMALLFLGLFFSALLLLRLLDWIRTRKTDQSFSLKSWWLCAGAGLAGIVLSLPWLVPMLVVLQKQATIKVVLPSDGSQKDTFQYILYLLGPTYNYILLILAALFLIYAWWKKESRPLALWAALLFLLNLPWGLRLGPFRPDHFSIVLFIPAALLLGGGMVWLAQQMTWWTRGWIGSLFLLVAVLFGLGWGMKQTQNVLNPVTVLTDAADRAAIKWVDENTPADARFLANTTSWIYETYRGVDGGYWIMPVTRRFSVALPGLYSFAQHDLLVDWQDWTKRAAHLETCDESFWSLVKDAGLTHLYLHEGKGDLQPDEVEGCQGVRPIYQRDGVWVYELTSSP